jgi:predicted DNA-binding ribbon-helix-helix protein
MSIFKGKNDGNNGLTLGKLFSECTPEDVEKEFASDRRSIRIHGHSTTLRLEKSFWDSLEKLASDENMTVPELITAVHDHCPQTDSKNLASCLRVICLRIANS